MTRDEILKTIEDALLPAKGWLAPELLTLARQDARKVYAALDKAGFLTVEYPDSESVA